MISDLLCSTSMVPTKFRKCRCYVYRPWLMATQSNVRSIQPLRIHGVLPPLPHATFAKLMTHIEFPKLMPKSPKVGSMNRQSPPIHINWDPLLINMIISLETVLLITVYTVTWRHHLMQWMNLASSTISTIPIASHTNPNPPITPPPTNYEWLITFCFFLGHELLFVSIDIYYTRF